MFVLKSTSSFARSISAGGYVPFVLRKSRSGRKRWRSMYLPSVEVRSLELVAMVLEIAQRAGDKCHEEVRGDVCDGGPRHAR